MGNSKIRKYFSNRELLTTRAKNWTLAMEELFYNDIEFSSANTKVYDNAGAPFVPENDVEDVEIEIIEGFHQKVLFDLKDQLSGKTCIHNFASYKHPGGMFLKGSSAQEEALCHNSFLYNVLVRQKDYYAWNNAHCPNSLYLNRALYSPDIHFINRTPKNVTKDALDKVVNDNMPVDVLTCAAPNISSGRRELKENNEVVLISRIQFIHRILEQNKVDYFITGAFGCGVFAQNPREVAEMMKSFICRSAHLKKVFFVIPAGRNLDEFKKVFE